MASGIAAQVNVGDVQSLADGKTTRTVYLKDHRVLIGAIEQADIGLYNVMPEPIIARSISMPAQLIEDIRAHDIDRIE